MKKIFILLLTLCFTLNMSYAAKKQTVQERTSDYINIAFWQKFNDDILTKSIMEVYENNNDLKAVSLKVNEAQRLVKISLANELPTLGFDGYIGQTFKSSDLKYGSMMIPDYTQTRFILPLQLSYEVDIWGKNRLKTKSYEKQLEMRKQDEKSVYIMLTSAFAIDYYNLIKVDRMIELQKELIKTQEEVCSSVKTKYEIGTANEIDVIRNEKALTYLKEELNNLLEKQDVLQNQINVLLSDREFSPVQRTDYSAVNYTTAVPNSINAETLEVRPDWVKSQLNLERVGIDVKVARRELLPSFTIVGNLGFNMYNLSSAHKFLADLAVMPVMDLFAGGRKIQFLKLQKDEYEIALQNYSKVILTSIQETNDALYSLKNTQSKYEIAQDRLKLDAKETELIDYKNSIGMADNLDKLYKREEYILSEKEEASHKIDEIIASINLYQALGGVDFTGSSL